MADKTKELEQRIDRIESKLKSTFLEIERRFAQKSEGAPLNVDERLQEFEDLILLMQLEITKLREKSAVDPDFGVKMSPDVEERLRKLEEAVAKDSHIVVSRPVQNVHEEKNIDVERKIKNTMPQDLDEIERRLKKIEQGRTETTISSKSVLEDVKKILNA
ncbi:MAG: hypothetical protein NT120_03085 [Candidatus Aenigmarchaeota archaeon]|nr:hypothetical protein [Candidatus Aenigmarchaeota archaeon]